MNYLIAALAVYRLSAMLALEDGPADLFVHWRSWVYRYARARRDHWLWRGVNCPLCISFWLGWLFALLLPWRGWGWYAATALALSAVTVVLHTRREP